MQHLFNFNVAYWSKTLASGDNDNNDPENEGDAITKTEDRGQNQDKEVVNDLMMKNATVVV